MRLSTLPAVLGAIHRTLAGRWRLLLVAAALLGAVTVALAQGGTPNVGFTLITDSVGENAGTYQIQLALTAASTNDVTVQYAVTGGTAASPADYTIAAGNSGTVVFPAGTTTQSIAVTLSNNPLATGDVTVQLTLSNPTNANLSPSYFFTLTIKDTNSPPPPTATVSFDFSSWTCNESDGTTTISATMTGTPSGPVSVNYATTDGTAQAGVNYYSASGTLTWQPSQAGQSQTFTIILIDDGTVDPTLTVKLTLSNPVNATLGSPATLNILDADTICP